MTKLHPLPCFWMEKSNFMGEQRNFTGVIPGGIFSFSPQRVAPRGKLHPNLVGSAGVELNLHQAGILLLGKHLIG